VSYLLVIDETGGVQRLTVCTSRAQGKQYVTLARSEESVWLVDHRVDLDVTLGVWPGEVRGRGTRPRHR
jgi:hypothetical protein